MLVSRVDRIETILRSGRQYVVPSYQRPYAWRKEQWEMLWQDILETISLGSEREHFLGAWISMPIEDVAGEFNSHLLIDGQQRLITVSILLATIRDVGRSIYEMLDDTIIDEYLLTSAFLGQKRQPIIRVTPDDKDMYNEVLVGEARTKGLITAAYRYYSTVVKEYVQDRQSFFSLLRSVVRGNVMVGIELSPDQDPLPVFLSLNTRGINAPPSMRPKVSSKNRSKQASIISKVRSASSDEEIDLIDKLLAGLSKFRQDPELIALISAGESDLVEFKIGACRNPRSGNSDDKMRENIIKAVAAFMNSTTGGTVLIGVRDDGVVVGINEEYSIANKNKPHWDGYALFLADVINNSLNVQTPFQYYEVTKHIIDGKDVCRIRVTPAPAPAYFNKKLFVRTGNQSLDLQGPDLVAYIKQRWPDL